MLLFFGFLGVILLVFILSIFLSPIIESKTGTEIILLSILLVLVGFFFNYLSLNNIFDFIGFGLVLFGLVIGVSSFLFKRN
ncbi:hypothetical protein ACERII_00165 [Evansella sp. AB-rgal1]|uniref:hypothetical protein n=1 Tax=Evansella sp. AB-rgal1 TaxID=3242696 RepID=UPI00359DC487